MRSALSRPLGRPSLGFVGARLIEHPLDRSRFAVVPVPLPPELVEARYVPATSKARLALFAA